MILDEAFSSIQTPLDVLIHTSTTRPRLVPQLGSRRCSTRDAVGEDWICINYLSTCLLGNIEPAQS